MFFLDRTGKYKTHPDFLKVQKSVRVRDANVRHIHSQASSAGGGTMRAPLVATADVASQVMILCSACQRAMCYVFDRPVQYMSTVSHNEGTLGSHSWCRSQVMVFCSVWMDFLGHNGHRGHCMVWWRDTGTASIGSPVSVREVNRTIVMFVCNGTPFLIQKS
jgi:hypothetical protein